jgi:cytochrome P450 family 3 subfamily A
VIAGYETTSTALSYATYILATHSEEQRKRQEHIDTHFHPENEQDMPTYETISEVDYLDMFIRESF